MADWKDEARGIPVWEGVVFYDDNDTITMVCTGVDGDGVRSEGDAVFSDAARCFPALDNPDTQAAYLRRLALRLGCPEEVAAEGVMFMRSTANPSEWLLTAGHSFCHIVLEDTDDRLLALVRAWRTTNDG